MSHPSSAGTSAPASRTFRSSRCAQPTAYHSCRPRSRSRCTQTAARSRRAPDCRRDSGWNVLSTRTVPSENVEVTVPEGCAVTPTSTEPRSTSTPSTPWSPFFFAPAFTIAAAVAARWACVAGFIWAAVGFLGRRRPGGFLALRTLPALMAPACVFAALGFGFATGFATGFPAG